ncbi:glycosyltransferase family 4 protein [Actinosynnema pretiosum subsp. pretiosum]|uniref:Glycosyltransferase family 4 protein n=2 Tax=Actinosynnema pretiosum TaxID=42197 RepID=A0AA45LCD4_9PSEU|nr:glycosyltransferase family 4 protein [Actinosynnema pretiosum]AXX28993.1 glycosyl transferase, group 1 [Actinosynnema pretiosum subsp. pretiosum]QUF06715.1 glycosyltransferase family 4 protein [Actinosynnema pretiosum subsp. pretiosum]
MRMPDRFDVTVMLDYYAPYVSGLTEAARLTAEGLAGRGWKVAVVCARHDRSLPSHEVINGVHVFRAPVMAHISRGFIAPHLPLLASRLAARSDLLHVHLPNPEAAFVAALRRKTPMVVTYHIDTFLPDSPINRFGMRAVDTSCAVAIRQADLVITNTEDQARDSRIWSVIKRRPLRPIPSPCVDRSGGEPTMRDGDGLHIGFMGRITVDKGIEYLIRAFRGIDDPDARLLIAGDYTTVAGGSNIEQLRAEAGTDSRIRFTGLLRGDRVRDFYASIDVFSLPSISESFGIVQVEAMMAGKPSVTTNLPGANHPVQATGFGRLVEPRDPVALREALLEMAALPAEDRQVGQEAAIKLFGGETFLDAHEEAYRAVLNGARS